MRSSRQFRDLPHYNKSSEASRELQASVNVERIEQASNFNMTQTSGLFVANRHYLAREASKPSARPSPGDFSCEISAFFVL